MFVPTETERDAVHDVEGDAVSVLACDPGVEE